MMSVYEALKRAFADRAGLASTADLGPGALMVAGGAAGTSFWLAVFPTDVIKSRWQVAAPGTYRSLAHCTAALLREGGVRSLWRGFGPALTRAFPANAACFAAYEAAAKVLGG
jgi:solute carrier family 25 carnitine/acylcarnitine transporter 20/29